MSSCQVVTDNATNYKVVTKGNQGHKVVAEIGVKSDPSFEYVVEVGGWS